jgi:hypothetical protein
MEYCYIVVIKKAGAWGCRGGVILPISQLFLNLGYVDVITRF